MDVGDFTKEKVLELDWIDEEVSDDLKEFISDLVCGTIDHLDRIDDLVKKYSSNWSIERISPVDKSILRFSIYSLLYRPDIPPNVVIDEAVEISKLYSTEKSYQFINGILDGIKNNERTKK
ncbi:MAG: transcription antitermination factor NusB [Spirochaetes bacterium]|nr:transcription antitermination factor NusB [Spirochaetota bacterium]